MHFFKKLFNSSGFEKRSQTPNTNIQSVGIILIAIITIYLALTYIPIILKLERYQSIGILVAHLTVLLLLFRQNKKVILEYTRYSFDILSNNTNRYESTLYLIITISSGLIIYLVYLALWGIGLLNFTDHLKNLAKIIITVVTVYSIGIFKAIFRLISGNNEISVKELNNKIEKLKNIVNHTMNSPQKNRHNLQTEEINQGEIKKHTQKPTSNSVKKTLTLAEARALRKKSE